ncbi:MAG: beta strand repeat-containing protein [Phycisphaerales bacterium]
MKRLTDRIRKLLIAIMCAATTLPAAAQGQGSGIDCVFVNGSGNIQIVSGGVEITIDTNLAILECNDFTVGPSTFAQFIQLNSNDRVLARVVGGFSSNIDGSLIANGIVYLANPNGIFFGSGSSVAVGGLFAVAGDITNADFLSGLDRFTTEPENDGDGVIDANGTMSGDLIHLIASRVRNAGNIDVGSGALTMISGRTVTIMQDGPGDPVSVVIDALGGTPIGTLPGVEHTDDGSINALGGQVILAAGDLYSLAVESAGPITATNGRVELTALEGTVFHNDQGGSISADGGTVLLETDDGLVLNQAQIDAANGSVTLRSNNGDVSHSTGFGASINAPGGNVLIEATGAGFVAGDITGGDVAVRAGGDLTITQGDITADTGSLLLHGGSAGNGDLLFGTIAEGGTIINLFSDSITLRAGDGFGGASTTGMIDLNVDGFTTVQYFGAGGFSTSPDSFTFRQDAAIVDTALPPIARFPNGLSGVDYTVQSDDGSITMNVGGNVTGSNLFLNAFNHSVDLNTAIALNQLTINAPDIGINTGMVTTTTSQTYNGAVEIGQDTMFAGNGITFSQTLDSAGISNFAVIINDSGTTSFGGNIGGNQPLASLSTNAGGITDFAAGTVTTTGNQSFADAVRIRVDTTFTGINVRFLSTLDSATAAHRTAMVNASGETFFGGAVGVIEPLFALITDAPGTTVIDAGQIIALGSGDLIFNDPVFLQSDTTLTAENVTFNSTLDTGDSGPAALTINASVSTTFNDIVGGISPLRSLFSDAPGTLLLNGGEITTTTFQTYNDTATLGVSHILNGTSIAFNGSLNGSGIGTQNLLIQGPTGGTNSSFSVGGPIGAINPLGDLTVRGTTFFSDSVTTTGVQRYVLDATSLDPGVTLDASLVQFLEDVLGDGGSLTIVGNVEFGDAADDGDVVDGLIDLTVGGTSLMNVNSVTTSGNQTYNGDVMLVRDGNFTGATVAFNEDVLANGNDLNITGNAVLGNEPGDRLQNVDNLSVTGSATVNSDTITTTGNQTFSGPLLLGTDVIFNGVRIDFAAVNGGGNDFTINATDTFLNGPVNNVAHLETDAAGTTRIGADITVTNGMTFNDPVLLIGDAQLSDSGGGIIFRRELDGQRALVIRTTEDARFGGNIGEVSALLRFETIVDGTLIFEESLIQVVGDIIFNDQIDLLAVPAFATIGADGNLVIQSLTGNFTMGQDQKMSILGDLTINAPNGTVTIGDVNTLGDFRITANSILLLSRAPGFVRNADGSTSVDTGLDEVAGGRFFFNVTPVLLGAGSVQFSNPQGNGDALGTLAGFDVGAFGPVSAGQIFGGGVFFDLAARNLLPFVNIGNLFTGSPGLLLKEVPPESELEEIEQDTPIRASELDALGRNLSIYGRVLSPVELAELVSGRSLYIDPPSSVFDLSRLRQEIVIQRMLYGSIAEALATYEELTLDGERPLTQMRDELNDAYVIYLTELPEGEDESIPGLAQYLRANHPQLMGDINKLNQLMQDIRIIGQTPAEVAKAEAQIIEKMTPREMDPDMLRELIRYLSGGAEEPTALEPVAIPAEETPASETLQP